MKTFFSVVDFLDAMYSKLLLPDISSPTRITSTSATLIDNIFTKDYDNTFTSGNLVTTFSDHVAQILVVPIRNITRHKEPKTVLCDFQEILRNKDIISRDLQNTNWDTELQLNSENINISTEKFISKINNLINHWAPLKELSNAKQKLQNKPWITKGILKSIKNKNKQYKIMCRTKNLTKRKLIEQQFKTYKNNLLKLTRASKFNHYNNYFQENRLNLFKTWEGIRDIINITKKSKNNINSIQVNGRDITDPAIIANEFNNHFTTIAKEIEAKLIPPNLHFSNYLSEPVEETLTFRAKNELEVTSIINSLNARKAFGPASIPTNFLKLFKNELSKPISLLANISLDTSMFPNTLKTANVTPIFKNDDPALCNNYRPISLLSNISKIFEKIIHARLSVFLSTNNILYEKQFGFRNQHSTNHALIEITEKIKQCCDSGKVVCGVFLDFQKAFDTVNHDILLKNLSTMEYVISQTNDSDHSLKIGNNTPLSTKLGPLINL